MRNVLSVASPANGLGSRPASLRAILGRFSSHTAGAALSAAAIEAFHRSAGAKFGRAGPKTSPLESDGHGWVQPCQLTSIRIKDLDSPALPDGELIANVRLTGLKCFGTYSDLKDDSTYAVISLISMDPGHEGADRVVKTMRTDIVDGVKASAFLFREIDLGNVSVTGSGIVIHVAVWRHVDGNADDIRDKIAAALNDVVNKGVSAIAGDVAGDSGATSGAVGNITDFSVGGVKPIQLLTLGLAGLIASFFADELIGEKVYVLPAEKLLVFADPKAWPGTLRTDVQSVLAPDARVNWPPSVDQEQMFDGGGASYKPFFLIDCTVAVWGSGTR